MIHKYKNIINWQNFIALSVALSFIIFAYLFISPIQEIKAQANCFDVMGITCASSYLGDDGRWVGENCGSSTLTSYCSCGAQNS